MVQFVNIFWICNKKLLYSTSFSIKMVERLEHSLYWSDSETLTELNKSIRNLLDDEKGIRKQVQWYVDRLSHYSHHIDNHDIEQQDSIPLVGHGETDLEGAKFQYSFWFEAMIWFIKTEVEKRNKKN